MSIRRELRKLKSTVRSWNLKSSSHPTPTIEDDSNDWPNLRHFHQTLVKLSTSRSEEAQVQDLAMTVDVLIGCILSAWPKDRQEYDRLREDFERLFKELQLYFDGESAARVTENETIAQLCRQIQHELLHLQENRDPGKPLVYATEKNEDDQLECYRRIQTLFQSVKLSILALQYTHRGNREFKYLMPVLSAHFSSDRSTQLEYKTVRRPCTRGTRVEILDQIHAWMGGSATFGSVYWINGMAGTGKTTIAHTMCEQLSSTGNLAASFFCSREHEENNDNRLVVHSIAYQLIQISDSFRYALAGIIATRDPDWLLNEQAPGLLFHSLISEPLLQIKHTLSQQYAIVIDGLDECEDKEGTRQLLEAILDSVTNLPVKFIISSRPEPQIRDPMRQQHQKTTHLRQCTVALKGGQTLEDAIEEAGALFIYATEMESYFDRGKVDKMYTLILQESLGDRNQSRRIKEDMKLVLQLVLSAPVPLTIDALSELLEVNDTDRIWTALQPLWSVLHVSEDSKTVAPLHPSFAHYALDSSRSSRYYCGPKIHVPSMAQYCLTIAREMRWEFNICELHSSYVPDNKIAGLEEQVQQAVSAKQFYAARHWAKHLRSATRTLELSQEVEAFLSTQLLLWMEIMNLKGYGHEIPEAIWQARQWAESDPACSEHLVALIYDAWKFTTIFTQRAPRSTPHIYTSTLLFWPKHGPIAKCYERHIRGTDAAEGTAVNHQQGVLLATRHFNGTTNSPVYSPDGNYIALGVGNDVILLSASTGQLELPPFHGHSGEVLSTQFSSDSSRVTSASFDKSIRIWCTRTGETVTGPLHGHTGKINSVAFSPDGTRVVSACQDSNVNIWCSSTGECLLGPLTGPGPITEVKFALDGRWVATCTRNKIVAWDADNGRMLKSFSPNNNDPLLRSVDISPDCMRIVSCSAKNWVYVWDVQSAEVVLGPLDPPSETQTYEPFAPVSFSPDGSRLISTSADRKICLWEAQTGSLVYSPLEGHTDSITSLNFSPDGAYIVSGSSDKTFRLWSARSLVAQLESLQGHAKPVTSVGFSPDGTHLISGSTDGTVCKWDSENGEVMVSHLKGWPPILYSPDGSHILFYSPDGLVRLDSRTDKVSACPIQPDALIRSAVFTSDGTRIILGLSNDTVHILTADSGEALLKFCPPNTNQSKWVHITSVTSSPDSTRIAVGSMHFSFSIHDVHSGRLLCGPYDGRTNNSGSLAFSPDGARIVFGSFSTVQVRDVQNGELVFDPLEKHKGWVTSVDYSADGTLIVSGGRDNDIYVWDAQTGQSILGPIGWHTAPVRSVRFSPDGTRVVSGSDDKTIRITNIRKDFEYPLGYLLLNGSEWELNKDGWAVDDQGRLLVWIPPELHPVLMSPRTELLISQKGWLRLDFSKAYLGEAWTECYKLEPPGWLY